MVVDDYRGIISSRSMSTRFIASSIAQRPILKSQIVLYRLFMLDESLTSQSEKYGYFQVGIDLKLNAHCFN